MDQRRSTITLFHKENDMYNGERLRHSFFGFGSARMKLARRTERRRFGGDDNQAFVTLRRCCGRRSVSSLFTKNARLAFVVLPMCIDLHVQALAGDQVSSANKLMSQTEALALVLSLT